MIESLLATTVPLTSLEPLMTQVATTTTSVSLFSNEFFNDLFWHPYNSTWTIVFVAVPIALVVGGAYGSKKLYEYCK